MPHFRKRHILSLLHQQAKFWPVLGVLGLRQSGKSTLFRELLDIRNRVTLDHSAVTDELALSAPNFLSKYGTPLLIDEAQKSGPLFDAIKWKVDEKRIPGSYFLTGSSQFSAKLGIRESLTGRIGIFHLYPFLLSEAHEKPFEAKRAKAIHGLKPRFSVSEALAQLHLGGLPVPLFTRDPLQRAQYFKSWMETSILRDVMRAYGGRYDVDVTWSILRQMGQALRDGELPTLGTFKQDSRKVRKYLQALEDAFLIRKFPCHEAGIGKDAWLPTDCGIATHIMDTGAGEGAQLSLGRIFVLNEILASCEYSGASLHPVYFKTSRGAPVDLVWGDTVVKLTVSKRSQYAYEERSLASAVRKLKLKQGLLCAPVDEISPPPRAGLGLVPWTYWS